MLHDYIIFLTKDDELTKVILRQHQTRAVEKVIERVAHPTKRRGLIWHTQGSGKTLTMITIAAKLLRDVQGEEKPTVVMLVDRNELEAQLFRNITAYGIGTVQVAQSKEDLRRILRSDYRGLVVSMIHKFDRIDADMCPRANVVVLVDEAHRTTGGDLGNYLVAALPNATYIGFTGTPIDRLASGKGTFKVFGADDPQGYLDKYSIAESIADGTTVPLNYALAPSDLRVDRETLDREFLDLREAEGVSDQAELDAVLTRAVQLKEMMKAADRVDKIARFVADHYRENVEPMGFKAFLVGVDREACALYKDALDRYLPKAYSTVVYSPGPNDNADAQSLLPDRRRRRSRSARTSSARTPCRRFSSSPRSCSPASTRRCSTACTWTSRCATTCCSRPSRASTGPTRTTAGKPSPTASCSISWASSRGWRRRWRSIRTWSPRSSATSTCCATCSGP